MKRLNVDLRRISFMREMRKIVFVSLFDDANFVHYQFTLIKFVCRNNYILIVMNRKQFPYLALQA